MHARGEGDVLVDIGPGHVEGVRVGEDAGVAVGAREEGRDDGAAWDLASAKNRVVDDAAAGEEHGWVVAQHLVDRARPQVRLLLE